MSRQHREKVGALKKTFEAETVNQGIGNAIEQIRGSSLSTQQQGFAVFALQTLRTGIYDEVTLTDAKKVTLLFYFEEEECTVSLNGGGQEVLINIKQDATYSIRVKEYGPGRNETMEGDRPDEEIYKIITDNDIVLSSSEKTNLEKLKYLVLKRQEHKNMTLAIYLQNHRFEVVTGHGGHYFVATFLDKDEMVFEKAEKPEDVYE